MDSIIKRSFGVNLRFLRLFGLYPSEKQAKSYLYKFRACVIYIFVVMLVPSLGNLSLIISEDLDKEQVIYNVSYLGQTTTFIVKLLPFVLNGHRIKKCMDLLDAPIFQTSRKNHKLIVDRCVYICRRNTKIFICTLLTAISSFTIKPLLWDKRRLPVDIWLPFNLSEISNITYYFLYVYIILASSYDGLVAAALVDTVIGGLTAHAASQLRILKDNLQNLSEYADEEILSKNELSITAQTNEKQKIIYKNIRRCVNHHNAIISFVKEFEICFSISTFSQISASTIVICFACLQDVQSLGQFAAVALPQVYFYCHYGAELLEESSTLSTAIYMGKWYDYDQKSRNALSIIIECSKRPLSITSGKLVELCLPTFATILKRSYSLFAVVENYQ